MRFSTLLPLLLTAGAAQAQFGQFGNQNQNGQNNQNQNQNGQNNQNQNGQNNNQNAQNNNNQDQNGQNNNNNNANANALQLDPNNVQTGSQADGLDAGAEAGQAASATDDANFINFCTGKTLTNGLQVKEGSCNGIPMGDIPAATSMVSAVMIDPINNDVKQANQRIDFTVQIANLQAGSFTNPDVTYYAAPQALNGGVVVGHTHITVQDLGGDPNPTQPLDAQEFAFFKGINDDGNGNGQLVASLEEGLPAGFYRVCSMTSASNHQPVLMPVAQRGPQDDCVRFEVTENGQAEDGNQNNNNQNADQNGQGNGQNADQNADQNGQGQQDQLAQGQQGQQAQGQQGQQAQGQQGQQGQGQQAQQGQGQGQQAQQGQQGQGQGGARFGKGRGRGRFGRTKFAAREFIA